jgi:hypothetical protein
MIVMNEAIKSLAEVLDEFEEKRGYHARLMLFDPLGLSLLCVLRDRELMPIREAKIYVESRGKVTDTCFSDIYPNYRRLDFVSFENANIGLTKKGEVFLDTILLSKEEIANKYT